MLVCVSGDSEGSLHATHARDILSSHRRRVKEGRRGAERQGDGRPLEEHQGRGRL